MCTIMDHMYIVFLFTIRKHNIHSHKQNVNFTKNHIHLSDDGNIIQKVHIQKEFMTQKATIFPVFIYA